MNVNVIDNQLLESLNNYFDTLSKLGYIKNSNSEALLVLSFLQEITSDYTELVTFLNSLSENYCIIPFLDLSTCKVDLNSSDQLVRFTANLDDVSAYINTSYLNNQLINFPHMAITGKSIQINDILAPGLGNIGSSILDSKSYRFVDSITLDNKIVVYAGGANTEANYPITLNIDHEKKGHAIGIKLLDLPRYTLNFISGKPFSLFTNDTRSLLNIYGDLDDSQVNVDFTVAHSVKSTVSSNSNNRWKGSEYVALTTDSGQFPGVGGTFTLRADDNNLDLSTNNYFKKGYDLTAIKTSEFGNTSGDDLFLHPIFIYYDPEHKGANASYGTTVLSNKSPYSFLTDDHVFNYSATVGPNNSITLISRSDAVSEDTWKLRTFSYSDTSGYGNLNDSGNTPITIEWETHNCIVLKGNLGIIPTTREDGTAEDIVADGIALSSCFYNNAITYIGAGLAASIPIELRELVVVSTHNHLLWCGKLFAESEMDFEFCSPTGTVLAITTAILESSSTSNPINGVTISTTGGGSSNPHYNTLHISFSSAVPQEKNYVLRLGGHIQYNTTTVNITGNISNMGVNIEGEGVVPLPASITVNRP